MPVVLVIDDDEVTLLLLQNVLAEAGFDVVLTADGPQGVRLYREIQPDAVILDLGLPTMDGTEVLKRILAVNPKAVVFVATGYGTERVARETRDLGAMGFLKKPLELSMLINDLNEKVNP